MSNDKRITQYRNVSTGELAPAHDVGTDENGDRLYQVPEGWEPVEPFWLDEEGLAHAE